MRVAFLWERSIYVNCTTQLSPTGIRDFLKSTKNSIYRKSLCWKVHKCHKSARLEVFNRKFFQQAQQNLDFLPDCQFQDLRIVMRWTQKKEISENNLAKDVKPP